MARSMGKTAKDGAVWIILTLLIVGLAGFGATNFGGSVSAIGKVGSQSISTNDYYRALQAEIRAAEGEIGQPVSLPQAEAMGLTRRARSQVVTQATLDNETLRLGLSVGDDTVREQVLSEPGFQGITGSFDRETYAMVLRQNGWNEREFEERTRLDTARGLLQGAVIGATMVPDAQIAPLYAYIAETRSYQFAQLDSTFLEAPVGSPDEASLSSYYKANPAAFTTPETRDITYAWLTPEMLSATVEIDEQELRALYDERIAEYVQPERRLVERMVFPSQDEARAAYAKLETGEISFEALAKERGLKLSDLDLGDVALSDLGDAGAAVFALAEPGVAGPAQTDLGPALFRVNAVLPARKTSFDAARPQLQAEAGLERARRVISDTMNDIDDLLAAGATLEELGTDTDMRLGQINWVAGQMQDIAGYAAFSQAAAAAKEGDFPELLELEDGGIFALRLNKITAPALQPLDAVRDQAVLAWQSQETTRRLKQSADTLATRLGAGESFADLGLAPQEGKDILRTAVSPAALSEPIFALAPGAATAVQVGTDIFVVRLDTIGAPDEANPGVAFLRTGLEMQIQQGIQGDLMTYFTEALRSQAGFSLNQNAINAVHAQIQ